MVSTTRREPGPVSILGQNFASIRLGRYSNPVTHQGCLTHFRPPPPRPFDLGPPAVAAARPSLKLSSLDRLQLASHALQPRRHIRLQATSSALPARGRSDPAIPVRRLSVVRLRLRWPEAASRAPQSSREGESGFHLATSLVPRRGRRKLVSAAESAQKILTWSVSIETHSGPAPKALVDFGFGFGF